MTISALEKGIALKKEADVLSFLKDSLMCANKQAFLQVSGFPELEGKLKDLHTEIDKVFTRQIDLMYLKIEQL